MLLVRRGPLLRRSLEMWASVSESKVAVGMEVVSLGIGAVKDAVNAG
jgi:hypothetical protein